MTARPDALAVFALSTDGHVTLRETTDGGWTIVNRRAGRNESTFHWRAFHVCTMLIEIRRLIRTADESTEFCQTLIAGLLLAKVSPRPVPLDEVVWGAFTDSAWVLTS